MYFIGEMKKHGIYDAFNDINKFSEFFEALPKKEEGEGEVESVKVQEKPTPSTNF